jgi:integrase
MGLNKSKSKNYIGFYIGARLSEILNIKWTDVNFQANRIIIIQANENFKTKSHKFRTVVLPIILRDYILELKEKAIAVFRELPERVIFYSNGTTPSTKNASSYLRKKYTQLGFKNFHAHCLRHTFSTEQYYGHLVPNYFDKTLPNFNILEA